MDKSVLNDFVQLVEKLLHLEALELDIFAGTGQTWTDELFEVISHKCPGLKHFGLNLFYDSTVKDEKFALLASLPNLCSVQVHSRCRAARIPILMLFEKLSLSGRLQYFNTSEVLFPEDVCQGLMRCRNLTQIFCGRDELRRDQQQKGFDSVLATLRIIHEGEQLPAAASDARILHTNFGKRSKKNYKHHPWVWFYEDDEQFPLSRVRSIFFLEECRANHILGDSNQSKIYEENILKSFDVVVVCYLWTECEIKAKKSCYGIESFRMLAIVKRLKSMTKNRMGMNKYSMDKKLLFFGNSKSMGKNEYSMDKNNYYPLATPDSKLDYAKQFIGIKQGKDEYHAFCIACRQEINLTATGKTAISLHQKTPKHVQNARASATTKSLSNFMPRRTALTAIDQRVTAAEGTWAFQLLFLI
uniref:Uncharacterized protein n=1 Tax=Ditylenchus dipsaci TaxID=166011 RepID=A0A915CXX2_9BILA